MVKPYLGKEITLPRPPAPVNERGEKRCTKCGAFKPLEDFPAEEGRSDGRKSACRKCESARVSVHHKANKDQSNAIARKWRENNRDKMKEMARKRYKDNPAKEKEKQKRYRIKNIEKVTERNRKNHARHYQNNKEALKAKALAYRRANPDIANGLNRRYLIKKRGAPINDFTPAQWREMQDSYDHRCAYCGKRRKGRLTQDHITPISKGGSHTLSNIVPACQSCNSKKHIGPPISPVQPMLITINDPKPHYVGKRNTSRRNDRKI